MSSAALTSLAILKVNWDRLGKDYIENFVPFVVEALRLAAEDVVSLPSLQRDIRDRFALDLPLNPLRQIIQRAAKHGFVQRQSGVFYRNQEMLAETTFAKDRDAVLALHDRVLSRLRDFVKSERGVEWTDDQAGEAIHAFLINHGLKLLYAQAEGTALVFGRRPRSAAYIVASCLAQSRQSDRQFVEDLTVLVKGHLLANAMYVADPGKVAQRFRDTRVFLDTSVIVYAAGFAGPERQAPCEELLRLLCDYGAELRCFDSTIDEVRGILDACAARLRGGQLRDAYGPSMEWFIESGRSASDVELMLARLPEKLRALRVANEERPVRDREFQVDEKGFEEAIQAAIGYKNPKARVHDVACVAAVAQVRRGRHSYDVESCGAIFVTSNVELARLARQFFQADAPEGAVALCITDYSLGNLLWLKNPTRAPDLPEKLLIADAYAAIQPPDSLWKLYLAEIARLEERGEINVDQYFALRHSLTAKRVLMDLTDGSPAAFSEGTVAEVLKVATEHLRADLREQLEQERRRRESAENNAGQMEQREATRRERIVARANQLAQAATRVSSVVLMAVLTAGAVLTFPWNLPKLTDAWYRYGTSVLLMLFFVFTVANIAWGTSVAGLAKALEARLAKIIHMWLVRIVE